jgi:hypothetical protein
MLETKATKGLPTESKGFFYVSGLPTRAEQLFKEHLSFSTLLTQNIGEIKQTNAVYFDARRRS